jgi:hypothetical protein
MNTNLCDAALWMTVFHDPVQHTTPEEISLSQLLNEANQADVRSTLIQGSGSHGTFTDKRNFQAYAIERSRSGAETLFQWGLGQRATAKQQRTVVRIVIGVWCKVLTKKLADLDTLAKGLLDYETLFGQEIKDMLKRRGAGARGLERVGEGALLRRPSAGKVRTRPDPDSLLVQLRNLG